MLRKTGAQLGRQYAVGPGEAAEMWLTSDFLVCAGNCSLESEDQHMKKTAMKQNLKTQRKNPSKPNNQNHHSKKNPENNPNPNTPKPWTNPDLLHAEEIASR